MSKTIIVCAPKKYSKIARQMVHKISKNHDFDSTYWSTEKYRDNESSLSSGQQLVVFLGNKKENDFTNDYLDLIENTKDESGACYGFDANKAFIFGTGNLDQVKEFFKTWKIKYPLIISFFSSTFLFMTLFLYPSYYILAFYSDSKKREKLVHSQTSMACYNFLEQDGFEDWISSVNSK